ncbi:MAG: LPS export ABC transporter permease LptG [Acidiferrobacterales bacterium]
MRVLTRLDRYIGRSVLYSTLLVITILLTLFLFLQLIDELRDYGKGNFGLYQLMRYVVLSVPQRFYELFPSAVLIGTIIGMSWLALGSELTAMRAAGISLARIVGAAMKIGVVSILFGILIGEVVVPISDTAAERGRAEALQIGLHREKTGLWLRDQASFVNVGEVLPDLTLLNVNIYRFDAKERLRTQTFASRARYKESAWRLEDVNKSWIDATGVRTQHASDATWKSTVTPDVVKVFAVQPQSLSTADLYDYIEHLRRNRQDTRRYDLAFWQKLLLPVGTAVMVLLAVPAVFGQARSGGMGQRVFLGIVLGLGFGLLNKGSGNLALTYDLPPLIAASLPIVLFLLLALYLLRRVA